MSAERAPEAAADAEAARRLGCFRVAGQPVGIDVRLVREVVRHVQPTPLPGAPAWIEGVIDLRGRAVPVVDLARALGRGELAGGPSARIAVCVVDGLVLGLAVDAGLEVMELDASQLEPAPALARRAGCELTQGVAWPADGQAIPVLDLDRILAQLTGGAGDPRQGREAA